MHTLYLMTSCVLRLRIPSLCPLTATGDDSPLPLSVMLPQNVGAVVVRNYDVGIIWYTVTEQTLRSSSSWQRTRNQCWITQKNCAIRKCCSSNVIYAGTWNMIDIRIRLMIGATEIINRKDCYYRNLMTKRNTCGSLEIRKRTPLPPSTSDFQTLACSPTSPVGDVLRRWIYWSIAPGIIQIQTFSNRESCLLKQRERSLAEDYLPLTCGGKSAVTLTVRWLLPSCERDRDASFLFHLTVHVMFVCVNNPANFINL